MQAAPVGLGAKIALRLIVPLIALFVFNSLDRGNVSLAALQMNAALGLSAEAYGFGVSIFFLGYIFLQYPHVRIQRWIGARKWILAAATIWGSVATLMAFIQNKESFYALRFLLGAAEGGFAPGVVYYLTQWAPRRYRAVATAATMFSIPLSNVLGGPLAAWLLTINNPLGMAGWRWLFLAEGLMTLLSAWLLAGLFYDRPEDAKWLSDSEKIYIRAELDREQAEAPATHVSRLSAVLLSPRTWAAALAWFGLMGGAYAMMFWLPLALKEMSSLSVFEISMFTALPWAAIGTGMMLNAWLSDRSGKRYAHFAIPALLSAGCYIISASSSYGPLAFGALILAAFFMGAAQGAFWPVPATFLIGAAVSLGVTVINMLGNSAGILIPPLIGWLSRTTGSFSLPVYLIAAMMIVGALMMPLISALNRQSERRSAEIGRAAPAA